MTGQNSLNNFYQSVRFSDPRMAALMADDVLSIALEALSGDKAVGQLAANRLREKAESLPEALQRVLAGALAELGYS